MGLYATMERGPQSAGMYTVHEFRHSKPVLSLAKPSEQLIRQSQATCPSVGRAAWRMVSQFSLGPSSFLCTQCDTSVGELLEGLSTLSAVFCPKKLCPGSSARRSVRGTWRSKATILGTTTRTVAMTYQLRHHAYSKAWASRKDKKQMDVVTRGQPRTQT